MKALAQQPQDLLRPLLLGRAFKHQTDPMWSSSWHRLPTRPHPAVAMVEAPNRDSAFSVLLAETESRCRLQGPRRMWPASRAGALAFPASTLGGAVWGTGAGSAPLPVIARPNLLTNLIRS